MLHRSPKTLANLFAACGRPSPLEIIHDRINAEARRLLAECFDVVDAPWRGIGSIPASGYALKPFLAAHDARRHFPDATAGGRRRAGEMPPGCDCARVVLGGNNVTLRVTGASVDQLVVQGQSNVVVAGDVTGLTLEGQANRVQSSAAGAVTVRGDGNTVAVAGAIGTLEITGANNVVSAPGVGAKIVRGDGNTVP